MIGIFGLLAASIFAIAGAFDGEMAMPATPLLIKSSTICTSPASSALEAGPVYTQVYSELGFSLFHFAQPSPRTVKKGLSRPLTTTARVFFCCAAEGAAARRAASAMPAILRSEFLVMAASWRLPSAAPRRHGATAGLGRPLYAGATRASSRARGNGARGIDRRYASIAVGSALR